MQWYKWWEGFPDIHCAVIVIVAKGTTVVTKSHFIETQKGEYIGQPATGNNVVVDGISIDRFENKVVVPGLDA